MSLAREKKTETLSFKAPISLYRDLVKLALIVDPDEGRVSVLLRKIAQKYIEENKDKLETE